MPESQADIDALLAEVTALANEAVTEIGGDAPEKPAASVATAPSPPKPAPPAAGPAPPPAAAAKAAGAKALNLQRVLHLEVPVIVRLAERSMPLSDIVGLTSGAIIEFEKRADAELDLMINNKCIARGQAVKVGENFGLRVNDIGTLQDRIKALGG